MWLFRHIPRITDDLTEEEEQFYFDTKDDPTIKTLQLFDNFEMLRFNWKLPNTFHNQYGCLNMNDINCIQFKDLPEYRDAILSKNGFAYFTGRFAEEQPANMKPRTLLFPVPRTADYQNWTTDRLSVFLRDWAKHSRGDVFEKDILLFPIAIEDHWSLTVIINPRGVFESSDEEKKIKIFNFSAKQSTYYHRGLSDYYSSFLKTSAKIFGKAVPDDNDIPEVQFYCHREPEPKQKSLYPLWILRNILRAKNVPDCQKIGERTSVRRRIQEMQADLGKMLEDEVENGSPAVGKEDFVRTLIAHRAAVLAKRTKKGRKRAGEMHCAAATSKKSSHQEQETESDNDEQENVVLDDDKPGPRLRQRTIKQAPSKKT